MRKSGWPGRHRSSSEELPAAPADTDPPPRNSRPPRGTPILLPGTPGRPGRHRSSAQELPAAPGDTDPPPRNSRPPRETLTLLPGSPGWPPADTDPASPSGLADSNLPQRKPGWPGRHRSSSEKVRVAWETPILLRRTAGRLGGHRPSAQELPAAPATPILLRGGPGRPGRHRPSAQELPATPGDTDPPPRNSPAGPPRETPTLLPGTPGHPGDTDPPPRNSRPPRETPIFLPGSPGWLRRTPILVREGPRHPGRSPARPTVSTISAGTTTRGGKCRTHLLVCVY